MESDGEPYQTLPLNNLNQYYEDCSTFRKELTIFGSLVYHVNLIFDRIKAALRKSQVKYRLSRLLYVRPRDALLFYVLSDRYSEIQQGITLNGEVKGLS